MQVNSWERGAWLYFLQTKADSADIIPYDLEGRLSPSLRVQQRPSL
jgi:hypothetical protein